MTRATPRRRSGNRRTTLVRASGVMILAVSLLLTAVNVYGVVTGGLDREQIPQWPGRTDSRLLSAPLDRQPGEHSAAYLDRLAVSIHRRMAVYWKRSDQAVPLKENWLLHVMQYPLAAYRDYSFYGALDPADTPLKYEPKSALVNLDFVPPQQRAKEHPRRFSRRDVVRFMVDVFSDAPRARFQNRPTASRMVVFEPISYVLKWLLPALALSVWLLTRGLRRVRRRSVA